MNNTKITAIIAAGLACICLASCTDNTDNKAQPERLPLNSTIEAQPEKAHFTFLEHSQETPNTLKSADKNTTYVSMSAEKVSFVAENRADRQAAKNMNSVLDDARNRSLDYYDSLIDSLDTYLAQENPDTSVFPWETEIDYTCKQNNGRAISVIESVSSFTAGTPSGTAQFSYNFDPVTGNRINTVFYDSSDKESFDNADDVMYKKLVEKYGQETISYDNVSSSFVEAANVCWYFTDNGVKVFFNEGSIAPVEAGAMELEYSKEELPELAQKYFE